MPAEIAPLTASSIGDLLVSACKQYAGRPAFTCMGKTISFGEVERQSAAFGAFLQSRGLAKGARVAIMMPNVLQYPVAMMGILRAGYIVVNVNPLYTPRELEHQLKDSGAEAIIILENFAKTLQAVISRTPVKHVVVATLGDMLGVKGLLVNFVVRRVKKLVPSWSLPGHVAFNAAIKDGAARQLKPAKVSADDVAFLQYTGGTTGVSKGATLLHRNVLANVAQLAMWVEDAYTVKPKPASLVYICALPLYHIFALTVNALMGMQQGAENVLIPNPRDIPGFVKELQKVKFHIFPGLNTLFNALLNNEDFRKLDFKPMVLTLGGGMAVQKGVAERWKKLTGNNITEGYGLSETSPVATANRVSGGDFTGTIGLPLPSTEISIRDDDGNEMPIGEVGEICIKGPQVMAGYWNRPDETAKVMTAGRLLQVRRHGLHGRQGFYQDRRPQEGHDPGLGLQRLSERARRGRGAASGRAGSGGDRRAGRALGRSAETLRRQEGPQPHRRDADRLLQGKFHRLQAAEIHRVPQGTAEDAGGQDFAQGAKGVGSRQGHWLQLECLQASRFGLMFWFTRKKLVGSYLPFRGTRRS